MSDLLLWRQLKDGKKDALERIYREHAADLLTYGRKFSRDSQLIEDCVHDLFVELWKNRAGMADTDSIRRYLLVSLRRKVIRQLNRRNKEVQDSEPTDLDFEATIAIDHIIIEKEWDDERVKQVNQSLESLSKRQKEVIYLRYKTGLDYEEIGEVMGLNYQSARNLVATALKKLKQALFLFWIIKIGYLFV